MKVCLVRPHFLAYKKSKWGVQISYPLGLAHIASYLESRDTHVDIIEGMGLARTHAPDVDFRYVL